jgi:hypothetical protein
MPAQIIDPASIRESTYKAREVEGVLDLYFYRKIGFCLARLFARLKMAPATVTLLGGLFGIVAGHLYYYRDLRTNICGMVLHVCANALDNADGQLARLTNRQSRNGRIFDGLVDHLIFVSIYFHLALRCVSEGASPAIWLLALAAGASHALQSAATDYSRNAYLYFVRGREEFDSSAKLLADYWKLHWLSQPREKFLQWLYLNVTREQEVLAPGLHQLYQTAVCDFSNAVPEWLRTNYRDSARPMLRWWGLLMTNTRMLLLFVLILIGKPIWYFWFEVIPFNFLLAYLLFQQEVMSKSFVGLVAAQRQRA